MFPNYLKALCTFLVDPLPGCIKYKLQLFASKALCCFSLPYLTSKWQREWTPACNQPILSDFTSHLWNCCSLRFLPLLSENFHICIYQSTLLSSLKSFSNDIFRCLGIRCLFFSVSIVLFRHAFGYVVAHLIFTFCFVASLYTIMSSLVRK